MKKSIKEQLDDWNKVWNDQVYEEIVQIKPIPIPESMQKLVDEEVAFRFIQSGVSEEFLGRADVFDDIGRETFEKIAIDEEMLLKRTESTLECTNDKCRCKARIKENEGLKA